MYRYIYQTCNRDSQQSKRKFLCFGNISHDFSKEKKKKKIERK